MAEEQLYWIAFDCTGVPNKVYIYINTTFFKSVYNFIWLHCILPYVYSPVFNVLKRVITYFRKFSVEVVEYQAMVQIGHHT